MRAIPPIRPAEIGLEDLPQRNAICHLHSNRGGVIQEGRLDQFAAQRACDLRVIAIVLRGADVFATNVEQEVLLLAV